MLATGGQSAESIFPVYQVVPLFAVKAWLFRQAVRLHLRGKKIRNLAAYFTVERNLTILALVVFGLDVYFLNLNHYFNLLPFSEELPSLTTITGITVFLFYLSLLWLQLKPAYEEVVGVRKDPLTLLQDRIRIYLALVLPWLFINFLHDTLVIIPSPTIHDFMVSTWGEPLLLLLAIIAGLIWFPALLVRLLGCSPLPAGPTRRAIEKSCRQQEIKFSEICLWPLLEGRVMTAGVVGLLNRYRYLLITPALLNSLEDEELEAVVAHEIGHVKKFHLLLYLLLFFSFAVLLERWLEPLFRLALESRLFYQFLFSYEGDPELVIIVLSSVFLILVTLVYFRFIFGFFMRNFERQADLYSLKVMGNAAPLISVFNKIAMLGGNDRARPCWHHFSIARRVDFLVACEREQRLPFSHHLKVYTSLAGYFVTIALATLLTLPVNNRYLDHYAGQKMATEVILEKIALEPENPLWHQFHGDLLAGRKQYAEAIAAFEESLRLYPDNPEALNNLAWLLLTSGEHQLLDPVRALALAKRAAAIQARSHILDTLAEAYWQNGMAEMAIATAQRALAESAKNRDYYREQLKKFGQGTNS